MMELREQTHWTSFTAAMAGVVAARFPGWGAMAALVAFPVAVAAVVGRVLYPARLAAAVTGAVAQYASRPISEG